MLGRDQALGTGNDMRFDILHHLVCERDTGTTAELNGQ